MEHNTKEIVSQNAMNLLIYHRNNSYITGTTDKLRSDRGVYCTKKLMIIKLTSHNITLMIHTINIAKKFVREKKKVRVFVSLEYFVSESDYHILLLRGGYKV